MSNFVKAIRDGWKVGKGIKKLGVTSKRLASKRIPLVGVAPKGVSLKGVLMWHQSLTWSGTVMRPPTLDE